MYPSREEFTELIYYISELKHQLSSKIDEQTIKINDQSGVIEELLWQIRELSDKLRQMNQKVIDMEVVIAEHEQRNEEKSCVCRYENHLPGLMGNNRSVFSRQTSMISNRKNSTRMAKKNKTVVVDDDDNDVYETIEFSDSSSHVYTEPIRDYGVLRKVTIKTSPKQHHGHRKPPMGLKKSVGSRNLQNFTAMENVAEAADDENENEPNVELRMKPHKHNSDKLTNSLISDAEAEFIAENVDSFIRPRDASVTVAKFH